MDRQLQHR
jgi:hypothetical protein